MEEYLMGFDASFFGFNDSQAAAVSEFFKKTLDQNFLPSLCGGIMNSYESMMESMAVILFRGSFVPFWKGRFFFFRIRTPFSLELGPKKSMKKGSKRKTLGIWYVQASQMDPIQRNSMEVGVLVESFAVFWRLFMAFELPIVAVGRY